eukprot:GHVN01084506.1.p2 GENE.GHVN01084506.1~~GHVN01084506.1.p2  ORF type:complete len:103 (-),score=20.71 GHVN01084506.1:752-1060(-)
MADQHDCLPTRASSVNPLDQKQRGVTHILSQHTSNPSCERSPREAFHLANPLAAVGQSHHHITTQSTQLNTATAIPSLSHFTPVFRAEASRVRRGVCRPLTD